MEEEAVSTQAGGMTGDGGVGGAEGAGDLTEGGTFTEEGGDGQEEIATAEPVGGGEGGGREASAAGATAEVLEATAVGGSDVVTIADEVPPGSGDVESAARVGAARGMEAPDRMGTSSTPAAHAPGRKPGSCRSAGSASDGAHGRRNALRDSQLPSLYQHSSFHNLSRAPSGAGSRLPPRSATARCRRPAGVGGRSRRARPRGSCGAPRIASRR